MDEQSWEKSGSGGQSHVFAKAQVSDIRQMFRHLFSQAALLREMVELGHKGLKVQGQDI